VRGRRLGTDVCAGDGSALECRLNRLKCPVANCPGTFRMPLDRGEATEATKCEQCDKAPSKKKRVQLHKQLISLNDRVSEIDVDGMSDKDELDVCLG